MNTAMPRRHEPHPLPAQRHKTNRHAPRDERINPPTHKSNQPPDDDDETIQTRQMTMRTTSRRDGKTDKQHPIATNRTATRRPHETHGREDHTRRQARRHNEITRRYTRRQTRCQERDEKRDASTRRTPRRRHRTKRSTRERAEPRIRGRHDGAENQHELTQSKLNHT